MPDDLQPRDSATNSVARLMQTSSKPRCMEVELAGGLYGLDVDEVKEVVALKPLSRVFHAPAAIAGVVSLRGEVLTVIDVSLLLAGTSCKLRTAARVVVLRSSDTPRRLVGLLVDRLGGLRPMPPEGLAPVPSTLSASAARLVRGVITSSPPCSVLDIAELFQFDELAQFAGGDEPAP